MKNLKQTILVFLGVTLVDLGFSLPVVTLQWHAPLEIARAVADQPFYLVFLKCFYFFLGRSGAALIACNVLIVSAATYLIVRSAKHLSLLVRGSWPMGLTAAVLFLVSPSTLSLFIYYGIGESPLVTIALFSFTAAWFVSLHWSLFMRSVILAIVWSMLLWVNATAALWLLLATALWTLLGRRVLSASRLLVTILLLGGFLYILSWVAVACLAKQYSIVEIPFKIFWAQCGFGSGTHIGLGWAFLRRGFQTVLFLGIAVSPGFLYLATWAGVRHGLQIWRSGRLTEQSWFYLLGMVMFLSAFLRGVTFPSAFMALWGLLVIQSDPVIDDANHIPGQTFSTFAIAFVMTSFCQLLIAPRPFPIAHPVMTYIPTMLAIGATAAILKMLPFPKVLNGFRRWRPLLLGACLGYGLVVNYFLFRTF